MDKRLKTYRVATFYHPDLRCKVMCYLRTYNPDWTGCVIYTVTAPNGEMAKQKARKLRLADEEES